MLLPSSRGGVGVFLRVRNENIVKELGVNGVGWIPFRGAK
jgi:hypothetical protein